MGMYDYIICKAPIPGGLPAWIDKHPFQTKNLDCSLSTYTIAEDGAFSDADFSGTIEFYTSNIVGSGPGLYTQDGEDAEGIDCKAIFLHGKLVEPIEVHRKSEPAWPAIRQNIYLGGRAEPKFTPDEQNQRYDESLLGVRIYILWGGQDMGYWAKVVYETERTLCVEAESEHGFQRKGDLELLDRRFRDHIFFDSEEEALSQHISKKAAWDAEKRAFEAYKIERAAQPAV